jgi:hypothetical protein
MVPTIMAALPSKRTTILTPWYRQLGRLVLCTVLVRQETEAEAAVEHDVRRAQAPSLMTGGAVVIAKTEVTALEETLQRLVAPV